MTDLFIFRKVLSVPLAGQFLCVHQPGDRLIWSHPYGADNRGRSLSNYQSAARWMEDFFRNHGVEVEHWLAWPVGFTVHYEKVERLEENELTVCGRTLRITQGEHRCL